MHYELLNPKIHNRAEFKCKIQPSLENYFKTLATQDSKADLARCYVASDSALVPLLIGYYTLSSYSLSRKDIPEKSNVKYQPYLNAPVTLLGRLAIDDRHQRKGYGQILLVDALTRSYVASRTIGSIGVLVESIDSLAKSFYLKFGFHEIQDTNKLFMTNKSLSSLIQI
jgi:GNAT superfamily N-acetyltransferase